MYKHKPRQPEDELLVEAREKGACAKMLIQFRRRCVELYGRVLGRWLVAEEFDRFFWREGRLDDWLQLGPERQARRFRQFERALGCRVRAAIQQAELESRLLSNVAENEDRAQPLDEEPLDGGTFSVEGFLIRPERPPSRQRCPQYRPCPYVSCRYHLYLDITRRGRIRWNFPDVEIIDLEISCALDLAAKGPKTLEQIGQIMGGISRERVRQIEQAALDTIRISGSSNLADFLSESHDDKLDE